MEKHHRAPVSTTSDRSPSPDRIGGVAPASVPPEHIAFLHALGRILAAWAVRDPRLRHLRPTLERHAVVE